MLALLFSLRDCFRARAVLQAEILALRHQLLVLQRSNRGHRLCLGGADRVVWVWLWRLWNDWRSALLLVKPETVIAWHRRGFDHRNSSWWLNSRMDPSLSITLIGTLNVPHPRAVSRKRLLAVQTKRTGFGNDECRVYSTQ